MNKKSERKIRNFNRAQYAKEYLLPILREVAEIKSNVHLIFYSGEFDAIYSNYEKSRNTLLKNVYLALPTIIIKEKANEIIRLLDEEKSLQCKVIECRAQHWDDHDKDYMSKLLLELNEKTDSICDMLIDAMHGEIAEFFERED